LRVVNLLDEDVVSEDVAGDRSPEAVVPTADVWMAVQSIRDDADAEESRIAGGIVRDTPEYLKGDEAGRG
jgi:hypothetical protein